MKAPMDDTPSFQALYGQPPKIRVRAPGRVNLIGEHTDYNGGFVLPMAIPQQTEVELTPREDRTVRAFSANLSPDKRQGQYTLGEEKVGLGWIDYIQGVTWVLRREGFDVGGFDLWVRSDVPPGSGLSSSAALEVALLRGLREAFRLKLDDVLIALLGQKVECDFVGAPVGVMDQMASSLAQGFAALFLDTRTLHYERVPLPSGVDLIVINSGVTHALVGDDYRTRRAECERAAEQLGVPQLRDLSEDQLPRALALPDPLGRRTRHVVTENARTLAAADALAGGELRRMGELMAASHASMRDDFAITVPPIDALAEIVEAVLDGEGGARMTGGGFGGSVLALVDAGSVDAVVAAVESAYDAAGFDAPR
ncbi:MAG TPA: galactokinase, partial [Armatimonadota bacterium]|nr:galactokinase [Armatimonadota bacterium]